MSLEIEAASLKNACMEMIETIFICLPDAYKGTIYGVGKAPDLIVERITSGITGNNRGKISWGLPSSSEYNPPGRPWPDYRDESGRPSEAIAWCVERQKSWTAEDPSRDARNVRLQIEGGIEDFHHMEPVLVRKKDLNLDMYSLHQYPKTYSGDLLWEDSEYVVVAVIKIHFRPFTIKIGSHETKVIKKLSRSLGTELLSYQLRQDSMNTMQALASDRLKACNILADSLRNAITKSGMIFTLIKQEIGFLRSQWEQVLLEECNEKNMKRIGVEELNQNLMSMDGVREKTRQILTNAHEKFLELSLPPEQGERWVAMQIDERWRTLLHRHPQGEEKRRLIRRNIEKLKRSLYFGKDREVVSHYTRMPGEIKWEWVELIYQNVDCYSSSLLDRFIRILDNPALVIPSRERSRKTLIQLKALAETMNQLERNTNFLLNQVMNGNGDEVGIRTSGESLTDPDYREDPHPHKTSAS